mmetsp:Transcript_39429/g.64061  ORF Transcript_39429/g.64061 Transcript_39429/m.64061 type:complete len:205 (-) Transcript_39429:119-733(-)
MSSASSADCAALNVPSISESCMNAALLRPSSFGFRISSTLSQTRVAKATGFSSSSKPTLLCTNASSCRSARLASSSPSSSSIASSGVGMMFAKISQHVVNVFVAMSHSCFVSSKASGLVPSAFMSSRTLCEDSRGCSLRPSSRQGIASCSVSASGLRFNRIPEHATRNGTGVESLKRSVRLPKESALRCHSGFSSDKIKRQCAA